VEKVMTILEKPSYNEGQKALIRIWNNKLEAFKRTKIDTGYVTFIRPKKNTLSTHICKIPCESRGYVNDNNELIQMTTENFLLLMTKVGIEVNIT